VDVAASLIMTFVALLGLFLIAMWRRGQLTHPQIKSPAIPDRGTAEQMIATDTDSFIPMPDYLRTKDEMVAWMTYDLPRLISELHGGRRE
jgi:hypothetical protein